VIISDFVMTFNLTQQLVYVSQLPTFCGGGGRNTIGSDCSYATALTFEQMKLSL